MRKLLYIWLMMLCAATVFAQNTAIYDPSGEMQRTLDGKDRRTYKLGSGGTPFSKLKADYNGLYQSMYRGERHFGGMWAEGAWSTLQNTARSVSNLPGGYSLAMGGCYEYQYNYFRVQAGLGLRWQDVQLLGQDSTFYRDQAYDSQGYRYRLRYDFTNRVEQARTVWAEVPVLVGVGMYQLYLMGGVKLSMPISGSTRVRAIGTTTGEYEQFLGHFVEMDNHGLRKEVPLDCEHPGDLAVRRMPDVSLMVEMGYEWGFNEGWVRGFGSINSFTTSRIKLALFAEYGLMNLNPKRSEDWLYVPTNYLMWDFPLYDMNHTMRTVQARGAQLHNLHAGVKVTLLLGAKRHGKCVLCGKFRSEADW